MKIHLPTVIVLSISVGLLRGGPMVEPEIMKAQTLGHYDEVRSLLEKGADVNVRASDGSTLLMRLLEQCGAEPGPGREGALGQVKYLLSKGADPKAHDPYGVTPSIIADRVGSAEAKDILRKAGAKPFDESDPATKAAIVRTDAALLERAVAVWTVYRSSLAEEIPFETLAKTEPELPPKKFSSVRE